ncbi:MULTISPECIES: beta-ketoacyl-ACP synthase III [Geobacter]|uniref:Beta-ketoacyl-[acyl-carrier-protein] synthase III n=2 Tax=Geobacter TaxID=28231 RepID=A0A0C1TSX2_9BACT|nr:MULTISPECIES: beta-ketoacyl-ACP synthase III [Geobacter]ANA40407.1 3-oxoacyl-ACP synthase [Geobacter anodireducens]KIE42418.1 3-oxoacyl-ACP synthase [Geobacter soli]HMN01291.1 beta-ketoacyl-ACP synthase III [Geobacter anodireducens]
MMKARIVGTGSAVPSKVLTNFDLEKMVDTSDEWITTRTGIKERRIAADGEYTSTFATQAAERALEMAGVAAADIDLLIVATITPDFPFPATACVVQSNLKAAKAAAFDLSAACSGFIYALAQASNAIRAGSVRKALVIGAEALSRIIDWTDRNTCLLFGDGAGAVVLEACDDGRGVLSTHLHSDGSYWELLYQPGCGNRNPAVQKTLDDRRIYLMMQGNEVFKLAVRAMEDAALEALDANGLTPADISLFIPHQANRRIIDAIGKRLGLPGEKVYVNLDRFGNTSAASIPLALDEANRSGRIKPNDVVVFDAFGGGLTWGSALVRW